MILVELLNQAADDLRLSNRPVIVHASLRSFGEQVNGGAEGLLDMLLARGCTVLVPAFTEPQFSVTPPAAMRLSSNGIDYSTFPIETSAQDRSIYNIDCGLINPHLGALPATLLSREGAVRGDHPLNSFAAIGPRAADLIATQSRTNVYGPIRELAEQEGAVLLIGVGLNRMTALHLAEQQSGRRLFVRWARNADGHVSMVEVGSCSEGFPQLEPTLSPYARTTTVGTSVWRAYPAKQILAAATAAIASNQNITHCPNHTCLSCRDATAGGPVGPAPWDGEQPQPADLPSERNSTSPTSPCSASTMSDRNGHAAQVF